MYAFMLTYIAHVYGCMHVAMYVCIGCICIYVHVCTVYMHASTLRFSDSVTRTNSAENCSGDYFG